MGQDFSEANGRYMVMVRSGGDCEKCGKPASDWSHRKARSQMGTWQPSNGLALCRKCHSWAHSKPQAARDMGVMIKGSQDPLEVPVKIKTRLFGLQWMLLADDGTMTRTTPPEGVAP